jgi:hypothetical protein
MNSSTSLQSYQLPGTPLAQQNDYSSGGMCLYSAIGNAVVEALSPDQVRRLFGRQNPRNLQKTVHGWWKETLEDNEIKCCLEMHKGLWQDKKHGISTLQDYKNKPDKWGATLDIHLLARYLFCHGIRNKMVVHTKNTRCYDVHHPFQPSSVHSSTAELMPVTSLDHDESSGEIAWNDCIIIINTGNVHWSRAVSLQTLDNQN